MVSKASEDLPEPERPVNTIKRSRGKSRSMFFRLWVRAPRIRIFCMEPITIRPESRAGKTPVPGIADAYLCDSTRSERPGGWPARVQYVTSKVSGVGHGARCQ